MNIYSSGEYLENNPSWHLQDSGFKARHIHKIVEKNNIAPSTVAEIGCGAGGVLSGLADLISRSEVEYAGYDISHDAIEMARNFERDQIQFHEADLLEKDLVFDLLLVVDVFEHVPNYLDFIARCKPRAEYKLFHIPLDVHTSSVLRGTVASARDSVGHLHYFTAESALATVAGAGLEICDYAFTPTAIELYREHPSFKRAVANVPRWLVSRFSEGLAARWFGGYSLLVLAK
jgi:SAM-dependent methyltransferase